MTRKSELAQSRRHVLIYDEDWRYLDAQYGRYSVSKLGTGVAVRRIVHRAVVQLRQLTADARQQQPPASSEVEPSPDLEAAK